MSEEYQRIEVITGVARRRQWSTEAKLRIIEESFEPGETVSSVARRNGVAPNHGLGVVLRVTYAAGRFGGRTAGSARGGYRKFARAPDRTGLPIRIGLCCWLPNVTEHTGWRRH
jgi:transposase